MEDIYCSCKRLILKDTKDCLLVCLTCKKSMDSGDLELPSERFVFNRSCSEENPCLKERYEYVYSQDIETRIAFRDTYKYYNCIFCMPRVEHVCQEIIGVSTEKNNLLDKPVLVKLHKPLRVVEVENEE